MEKKSAPRPGKREEKRKRKKCPYLFGNSRICMMMVEKGLDGEVSSFDVKHFCKGNPVYCYYFRSHHSN